MTKKQLRGVFCMRKINSKKRNKWDGPLTTVVFPMDLCKFSDNHDDEFQLVLPKSHDFKVFKKVDVVVYVPPDIKARILEGRR